MPALPPARPALKWGCESPPFFTCYAGPLQHQPQKFGDKYFSVAQACPPTLRTIAFTVAR